MFIYSRKYINNIFVLNWHNFLQKSHFFFNFVAFLAFSFGAGRNFVFKKVYSFSSFPEWRDLRQHRRRIWCCWNLWHRWSECRRPCFASKIGDEENIWIYFLMYPLPHLKVLRTRDLHAEQGSISPMFYEQLLRS